MLENVNRTTFAAAERYIVTARNYVETQHDLDGGYSLWARDKNGSAVKVAEYIPSELIHYTETPECFLVHSSVLDKVQHQIDL